MAVQTGDRSRRSGTVRTRRRAFSRPSTSATTVVLAVAGAAWVALVVADGASGKAAGHDHAHAMASDSSAVASPVLTLTGWSLMVLAMMLPPALPLVGMLAGLLARHALALPRLVTALSAFVAVWVAAGVVLLGGATAAEVLVVGALDPEGRARVAGIVVVIAGAYQFTPVKNACLTACRSPRWFALRLWRGRGPTRDAAAIAAAYGVSCVGCCWALMLLCLGTSAIALPVMVVLAVVMAAERLVRHGRAVARTTGVLLVLLGAVLVAGALPPDLVHPLLGV